MLKCRWLLLTNVISFTAMVHQGRYLRETPTGRLTFAFCFSWGRFTAWGSAVLDTPRLPERTSNWPLHVLIPACDMLASTHRGVQDRDRFRTRSTKVLLTGCGVRDPFASTYAACKRLASTPAAGLRHSFR